jgi:hypothetical protein
VFQIWMLHSANVSLFPTQYILHVYHALDWPSVYIASLAKCATFSYDLACCSRRILVPKNPRIPNFPEDGVAKQVRAFVA